jgi:DNA-binding response OmpR family regulator
MTPAVRNLSVSVLTGAKVAVIDNDPIVLDAMQGLLDRWDCDARSSRSLSGLVARTDIDGFRPDIILADYHLDDGRNGLDCVHALRIPAEVAIPAIIITADRSPAIADAARELDCEVLLKPVKPAELRALMLHLLARAQPAVS